MSATWHDEMAEAVALRRKAMNGVARWQEKLVEAEQAIEQLSAKSPATVGDAPVVSSFGVSGTVNVNPGLDTFTLNS